MKKLKIVFIIIFIVVVVSTLYILFLSNNVFVHISNYSWDEKTVYLKTWIEKEGEIIKDSIKTDQLIVNDSIKADLTGRTEVSYSLRQRWFTNFKINTQVNNEDSVFKDVIRLSRYSFVYVTVHVDNKNIHSVDITSYSLKDAWKMGLIFPQKE